MRIFTCTPVAFGGGPDFFARDSGLLCRGFQAIGCESMAVMPGERMPEDEADLLRTEFGNLESAAWWRAQALDGLVLYAWGRPKFRKVAAAILAGQGRGPSAWLRFLKLTLRGLSAGLALTDPLRAAHLKQGDVIACVSPKAAEHYRKLCRIYGGTDLAARVRVVPHAVESRFRFSDAPKRRQVACVGRWQDVVQKRPWLLMEVVGTLVTSDEEVSVVIAGTATKELIEWRRGLDDARRGRVHLRGRVGRDELAEILAESEVFYSPSAFESFGIAAAEALCSGCSVVAGRSVSMAAFEWFVSENSGMLAEKDDAPGHLKALQDELNRWDQGARDPVRTAGVWCERLHADEVAKKLLEITHSSARSGDHRSP